jgi:hypothetical protein
LDDEEWIISTTKNLTIRGRCFDLENPHSTPKSTQDLHISIGERLLLVPRQCTINVDEKWIPTRLQQHGKGLYLKEPEWDNNFDNKAYQRWKTQSTKLKNMLTKGQAELNLLTRATDQSLRKVEQLHRSLCKHLEIPTMQPTWMQDMQTTDYGLTTGMSIIAFVVAAYFIVQCIRITRTHYLSRGATLRSQAELQEIRRIERGLNEFNGRTDQELRHLRTVQQQILAVNKL